MKHCLMLPANIWFWEWNIESLDEFHDTTGVTAQRASVNELKEHLEVMGTGVGDEDGHVFLHVNDDLLQDIGNTG